MDWQPRNPAVRSSSPAAVVAHDRLLALADIRGAVYIPSYAHNSAQGWMEFNQSVVCREMQFAADVGLNAVRVFLDMFTYQSDPEVRGDAGMHLEERERER